MQSVQVGDCRIEILTEGDRFLGLGAAWIGDVKVRSGRLPIRVASRSFTGAEIESIDLLAVDQNPPPSPLRSGGGVIKAGSSRSGKEDPTPSPSRSGKGDPTPSPSRSGKGESVRVRLLVNFRQMPVQMMRDHSFDPIHSLSDWDKPTPAGTGKMDIVLEPASDTFEEYGFEGFSYRYEYDGEVPLFHLMDMASWELGGDIEGGVAISQSSCSAPIARFERDTAWSTEGVLHFLVEAGNANPIMTHDLPRWASHGSFDFQYKGSDTLIGVFEHVELIRTVIARDAGKPELKVFDKYIFDQTRKYASPFKAILLSRDRKSDIDQKNLWTWIQDEVFRRARAEFGLREEPMIPRIGFNFADNFTVDGYYKDLLPAAAGIGIKQLFIDNLNKSSMSERTPSEEFHFNICCGHEYELAPSLGGPVKVKEFVDACAEHGIRPYSWTNNGQSLCSPLGFAGGKRDWYTKMEDARIRYGGAYLGRFNILNFKKDGPRRYWVECLKKNKDISGLDGYLFDSFYNLGFMPVDYGDLNPTTQWRELLHAFKELQDDGISFLIESLGPFGQVQHGVPTSYNMSTLFACYKILMGTGYTTIGSGAELAKLPTGDAGVLYRVLGHMTDPNFQLDVDGVRIDKAWTPAHKRALADYNANYAMMYRRFLQEDGESVIWYDEAGKRATVWNFTDREAELPGAVTDLSTGELLPPAAAYRLQACHTYGVEAETLPRTIPRRTGEEQ